MGGGQAWEKAEACVQVCFEAPGVEVSAGWGQGCSEAPGVEVSACLRTGVLRGGNCCCASERQANKRKTSD
eukprot:366305-Chlamydomonas_euryale.AAC.9